MQDIIPGSQGPRVVKLNWKLPARLRRPIRTELARQRRKKRAEQAIVRFERRPLVTSLPPKAPPPPYKGTFTAVRPVTTPRKPFFKQPPVVKVAPQPLSSPVHVSITPRAVRESPRKIQPLASPQKTGGKRFSNTFIFLVGCVLAVGTLWQLQRFGALTALLTPLKEKTSEAYAHLLAGNAALATNDFIRSEQEFTDASQALQEVDSLLHSALKSSNKVLEVLDITGTVRSGDALLSLGKHSAEAGEHVSRGLKPFFSVDVFPASDPTQKKPTLLDALRVSREEFRLAEQALAKAEAAIAEVNPSVIPDDVREEWEQLTVAIPKAHQGLKWFSEQSEPLMNMLGAETDRDYLVVFQNNHELRPTGGFIGSLGLIHMDRGQVEAIDVESVYDPDGQLQEFIAPPEPLRRITDRWYLRDANWFIDWELSAQKIMSFLEKEKRPSTDGVIALTPEVIRSLLEVTGPIEMPTYNVTVTKDNFIPLTQQQVTYFYDKEKNRPKQFMADLTPVLLDTLVQNPADSMGKSLSVLLKMVQEKHMLVYFRDEALQQQVRLAGWSGGLPQPSHAPALLAINNANIGGHKTDQFIEQVVDYKVFVNERGSMEAELTIRRIHHGPQEKLSYTYPTGEDPAFKDNVVYQRVLVPKGSTLLDAHGFTSTADIAYTTEEDTPLSLKPDADVARWHQGQYVHPSGTTVGNEAQYSFFGNWIKTIPGQSSVVTYRYTLPQPLSIPSLLHPTASLPVHLIKQPGDMRTSVRVQVTFPTSWRIQFTTPPEGVTLPDSGELVYRGALSTDVLVGALYEHR